MSEGREKATRRALRRAMGPEALDLVGEQAHALAQLAIRVDAMSRQMADHHAQLERLTHATQSWLSLRHAGAHHRWRWLLRGC